MIWKSIILLLIVIIPIALLLVFKNRVFILDQKHYWVVTLFALASLIYFIAARWAFEWDDFIKNYRNASGIGLSILYSKVMLLDLCPLMAVILPLTLFFDRRRKIAKLLCPLTIIGSLITLFGQAIWAEPDNFLQYLFLGSEGNRLYFMMHLLSLILAIWVLIISTNFTIWNVIWNFVFLVFWLTYVLVMISVFDIKCNATGLVEYDWLSAYGQYHKVYQLVPMPFPFIVIFWYTMAVIGNWLLFIFKNWAFNYKNMKTKYFPEKNKSYL